MRFPGFVGPSYKLNSVNVDCQRCINFYPEMSESGSSKEQEKAWLVATPGLKLLATIGDGPIRGSWTASNNRLFVVSKDKLYEVSSSWVVTERGTLLSVSGQVSISDNGIQLVVVDGPRGYVLTFATDVFAQITDEDFLGADQVTFQDGYFIFNKPNSNSFYISEINGIGIDGLDLKISEGNPDKVVGIISDHRDLYIFNERTIEIFYNSGDADFPFERIQGAFIEHGCAATFSIAKMNNTVFWLGGDDKGTGVVYSSKGYQPQRISTHAVEQAIQKYANIADAVAYTYQENGHSFYVLNFETANTTWVYDSTTGVWHERVFTNQGQFERHRANNHAFAFGKHIVGDYENGKIYELNSSHYSDDGKEISRRRVLPHISSGGKNVFYDSFQVDMESGTGLDGIGQGTDPKMMLRFSDDGGHTWSNEKWVSMGKIGQTKRRAIWRRLGRSRDRVFEITITDPVKVAVIGADLEFSQGAF